jgi:integrase
VATVETALDAARKAVKFTGAGDFVIQTLRRRGEPVPARYCNRALEAELAAIGITHEEQKRRNLTFHGLRHTFVTLGRLAGLTDAEIQALAGHAGGRMMENYSHVSDALDFAALKAKLDAKERKEA